MRNSLLGKSLFLFAIFACFVVIPKAQEGPRFEKVSFDRLVRIETSLGTIDIEVDPEHAPITVANFLRYVAGGFYDGGEFYRAARPDTYNAVLPNRPPMELIEARIPAGKQAYPPIPLERTTVTGLKHVTGVVAMGRDDDRPDSATNDFYILLNDQPSLDMGGKRFTDAQGTAAFGKVVAGLDVVRKIQQLSVAPREATPDNPLTKTQNLAPPVRITKAYRVPFAGQTYTKTIVESGPPPSPSEIGLGANTIGGLVHEVNGAPLVGATVTLTGAALAASRVAATDRDGKYQFVALERGVYTLIVDFPASGFKRFTRPGVRTDGTPFRVDVVLQRSSR